MKLYICGPMSGMVDDNFPAFNEAAELLLDAGYEVENPAAFGKVEGWKWEDYLKRDIPLMLKCDGVALLAGWHMSHGACLERDIAVRVDIKVKTLSGWLRDEVAA